jgi:hypothetical protein
MAKGKKTDTPTPPPAVTNICSSFEAELGAQVTFNGAASGTQITQVAGQTWPFCHQNGSSYPTITFPITSTVNYVYIKSSGLTLNQSYSYNVGQVCPGEVTKSVKIVTGTRLKKSA